MVKEILVVLGSPNYPTGELSGIAKSRLDYCKSIFTTEKLILLTGGWGKHFNITDFAHAAYAKDYLINKGIKESYFLEIALSKNTVDDAVKIKPIISKLEKIKLTIITSEYHLESVKLIFNEILRENHLEFVGVENCLKKDENYLINHEKKAIDLILKNGLYY